MTKFDWGKITEEININLHFVDDILDKYFGSTHKEERYIAYPIILKVVFELTLEEMKANLPIQAEVPK